MPPPDLWTRRASAALSAFAVIGAAHAIGLSVFATHDARVAVLVLVAVVYAIAAARSAWLLRRGDLTRVPGWLALWVATVLAAIGAVGGLFHAGEPFWWTSLSAILSWLVAGAWIGRRVRAEARDARRAAAPRGVSAPASIGEGSADDALQRARADASTPRMHG